MSFQTDIKAARERAGLTQAEAAAELRVARRALQHWEDGQRDPIYPAQVGALALLRARNNHMPTDSQIPETAPLSKLTLARVVCGELVSL